MSTKNNRLPKEAAELQLPVELTEAQRIEINAKLAHELLLKKAKDTEIAQCKEAIKTHDGNIALNLKELEDNARLGSVRCDWILYPDEVVKQGSPQIISEQNDFTHDEEFTGIKRLIREDTKGIVDELPMVFEDFQANLDLEDKDAKKSKDKKTKKA